MEKMMKKGQKKPIRNRQGQIINYWGNSIIPPKNHFILIKGVCNMKILCVVSNCEVISIKYLRKGGVTS